MIAWLQKCGLWPERRVDTPTELARQASEDNEKAFAEIKDVYERQVPEAQEKLKVALARAAAKPFIDLENIGHERELARRRSQR